MQKWEMLAVIVHCDGENYVTAKEAFEAKEQERDAAWRPLHQLSKEYWEPFAVRDSRFGDGERSYPIVYFKRVV